MAAKARSRPPVKQCSTAGKAPFPVSSRKIARHVGVGLARMDHQRQAGFARRRDVRAEALLLRVARAVVVVIVEPGLADRHHFRMLRDRRPARPAPMSSSSCALCGCVPTEQNTSGNFSAMASTWACRRTRVEIVTMRPTPAARARATTASSSAAKSGKSRWQWLSTSMVRRRASVRIRRLRLGLGFGFALGFRLDIARENAGRRRQCDARLDPRAELVEVTFVGADRQQIEQFAGRRRHERLRQDGDLPEHLRRHVQDGALPRRIGLGHGPGRLAGEIAVGVGHHRPDRVEHLVQLLRLHVLARDADHAVGGGQDRLVLGGELARRRQHAAELPCRSSTASAAPDCRDRWRDRH